MKRRQFVAMALLLAVGLAGPAAIVTNAQDKEKKKEDRVSGTIEILNKDTKTIVVQMTGGEGQKQVVWDDKTVVTKDNKPAKVDDLANGQRVICVGMANDKGQFAAHRIDIRPTH